MKKLLCLYLLLTVNYAFAQIETEPITYKSGSGDANFDAGIKKIIESSRDKFTSVLGEKHPAVNVFAPEYYDIVITLPGVTGLQLHTGNLAMKKDLHGTIYKGESETEAKKIHNEFSEKIKKALGSNYVFRKNEYGSDLMYFNFYPQNDVDPSKPSIALEYRYIESHKKYYVNISFY